MSRSRVGKALQSRLCDLKLSASGQTNVPTRALTSSVSPFRLGPDRDCMLPSRMLNGEGESGLAGFQFKLNGDWCLM